MDTIDIFNLINDKVNLREIKDNFEINCKNIANNKHSGSAYLILLGIKIGQEQAREKIMKPIKEQLIIESKEEGSGFQFL